MLSCIWSEIIFSFPAVIDSVVEGDKVVKTAIDNFGRIGMSLFPINILFKSHRMHWVCVYNIFLYLQTSSSTMLGTFYTRLLGYVMKIEVFGLCTVSLYSVHHTTCFFMPYVVILFCHASTHAYTSILRDRSFLKMTEKDWGRGMLTFRSM